ncbi:hypothetical protein [Polaribacter aquimarinus]|uniref:PsbP C-terminal domain-containing protein n=1 Tax=Polaribacter aquimarinus TaxID=2100726 RepID=A0A2U2JAP4_9FLAO|nr:hypothetical protein [Polaribacter aquimarinus]PWG05400.1 hypothetical protein DIS07_09225 [Polaribacter aquimarinus]
MKSYFLLLIICSFSLQSFSQIKAVTESGDEVVLYHDNTWKYLNDSINNNKNIITNNHKFETNKKSTFLVKSKTLKVGVYINPKKWSFEKNPDTEAAEYSFQMKNEDLYGMIITEKTQIPLLSLKDLAVENAKEVAPDIQIDKEEYRYVNGKKILMIQMSGTTQQIKFKYFSYYYSSDLGVVQLITYTSLNLFKDYEKRMEDFLNGFVEF